MTTHGQPTGQPPYERRETKQEREARRLERERQARLAERERSMKEEHIDGGYLVTLGTYVGPEDFNKQVVRQLQVRLLIKHTPRPLDRSPNFRFHRLSEELRRSGAACKTSTKAGQNTKSSLPPADSPSPAPTRHHLKTLSLSLFRRISRPFPPKT